MLPEKAPEIKEKVKINSKLIYPEKAMISGPFCCSAVTSVCHVKLPSLFDTMLIETGCQSSTILH